MFSISRILGAALMIRPLTDAEKIARLERELHRERARREDLERIVSVTALAIAENGSLDMQQFLKVQQHDAAGHA